MKKCRNGEPGFYSPGVCSSLLCSDIRLRVGLRVGERRKERGGWDGSKWLLKLLVMDKHFLHGQNPVYGVLWCD